MRQRLMKEKESIPWWNRIKVRVLVFGIIMSIVPLASLGYFHIRAAEEDLLVSIHQRNTDLANQVATDIEQLISGIEEKIGAAGSLFGRKLLQGDRETQEKVLLTLLRDVPSVEDLSVFDAKGQEVARVSRREVIDAGKLSQLPPELLGKQGVVKSYLAADGRTMVSLVIPFHSLLPPQVIGGFSVQVNLRPIIDATAARRGDKEGVIFVVNREGRLIGHEDFSQVLRQTPVSSSLAVRRFMEGKAAPGDGPLRYVSFTGEEVLGVYAPIKKVDWGAVVEMPVHKAYKPISSLGIKLFLITMIIVVLVVIVSIHFALRFTRPIEALEHGAKQVGKGELDLILPRTTDDEIGRLVETFNHMTRQLRLKREMEAYIIQTDKMAALGLLSAGVAHEINNPLATVSAYAEDLLERINDEDIRALYSSGELAEYLQVIRKQTERGKKITRSLLTFARHPAGNVTDINLNELLEDTLALLNYRIKHQGIEVVRELDSDLPGVKGDISQLQQVLLNLIGNSLDAMEPAGGRLTLVTAQKQDSVVLEIIDTGTGIAGEEMEKVFNPFYTTKPVGKGTGLGLSICYGIVKEMQGNIQISSEAGSGTTVRIVLPVSSVAVGKEGEENEGAGQGFNS